jgi:ubiquinone/menaquinone biosynthesis C-methylase UbiE
LASSDDARQLELIRENFTKTAKAFGDFVLKNRAQEADDFAEFAIARAVDAAQWRAMDLACGPGTFARALAKRVRFTVGVDLTPAMLVRARESVNAVNPSCAFARGDGNRLPFLDGSLDLAACGYSIHHVLNAGRVVAELARVVRSGGRVSIADMVARSGKHREAHTRIERARDRSHTLALTLDEMRNVMQDAGLRVLDEVVQEKTRNFDEWMSVVNAAPGSPVYSETRSLIEETMSDDSAGMRPRIGAKGLEYSLPTLFIVAEKRP